MRPIEGLPVLTAAEMRAAEERAIAAGSSVEALMARAGTAVAAAVRRLGGGTETLVLSAEERAIAAGSSVEALMARAGTAVAAAVRRLGGGTETLVLCGPGNNGGDGYVAAAELKRLGVPVRVAASSEPKSPAAIKARGGWDGTVDMLEAAAPAPVLVDALFGTGLARPLDDAVAARLGELAGAARLSLAVDLPSGAATDDGACLGPVPRVDVTLALGALKPVHLLQPAAARCGAVRVLDIGVDAASVAHVLGRPQLAPPTPADHKYSRGMVAIVSGSMAGAGELASEAALRAGAGYVLLLGGAERGVPHAVVRRPWRDDSLGEERIGAVLVGPGLGRDETAAARLDSALASSRPLVIDGDALHLVKDKLSRLKERAGPAILTPHAGEFAALFGSYEGSKLVATRAAAQASGAVVVHKGADTVIAAPDGRAILAPDASAWLSTAGTGDVLAGAVAALLAGGRDPFEAASAAVWLHGDAARRLGPAFLADDLAAMLSAARAGL